MCGITGFFALDGSFDPDCFSKANDLISYRGPDDSGYLVYGENGDVAEHNDQTILGSEAARVAIGALGFRRLAILDLSLAGHQPMADSSRRFWIVFNGEVYNYLELRSELESAGQPFVSGSDTEVVLNAYIRWGSDCLHRFNGMWSFCILDTHARSLFCARDRFGIKPFNYYMDDDRFIFGSEVKQVSMLMKGRPEPDSTTLLDFIIFGVKNHSERTFHQGVGELRGGQCMTIDLAGSHRLRMTKQTWWDLKPDIYAGTAQQAADELLELLRDSARIRLRSDVPIGTALSGGLDSTGLVALIDEVSEARQNVFTVVSQDKDLDELAYANQTIQQYGLNSFKTEFGELAVQQLEQITFHHDQPVTSASIFGGWILQTLVRDSGVIVNLNGQGADELMGGYSRPPHALRYLDAMAQLKVIEANRELIAGFRHSMRSFLPSARVFGEDIARFLLRGPSYRHVLRSRGRLLNSELVERHAEESLFLHRQIHLEGLKSIQKQQAYNELKSRSLPALLHNVDRDSMAHSLEARVPFLDYRVAEFIFSLPVSMLTKNGYTKHVYRTAMVNRIPSELLWDNNKKGFTTPANDYLTAGQNYFSDLLADVKEHPVLDMRVLKEVKPGSPLYGSAFHWRALCTLIWDRVNTKVS